MDNSLGGNHYLKMNTNMLNLSTSSTDSFLPVAFIDIKCPLPSDSQCSPGVQKVAGQNLAKQFAEESIAQTIAGESRAKKIAGESSAQKTARESIELSLAGDSIAQTVAAAGESIAQTIVGESSAQKIVGESSAQKIAGESIAQTIAGESIALTIAGKSIAQTVTIDQIDSFSEDNEDIWQSELSPKLCSSPIDDRPIIENSSDLQLSPLGRNRFGINIKQLVEATQHSKSSTLPKDDLLVFARNEEMASDTLKTDHVEAAETKAISLKEDELTESLMNKKRLNSVTSICEDSNKLTDKKNFKSPSGTKPLKLTFKLIGDKTICSISDQADKSCKGSKESKSLKLPSSSGSNCEETSEAKEEQVPKWLNELIDSSSDSEGDNEVPIVEIKEEIKASKPLIDLGTGGTSHFSLTCLPARSAAVKALSKMKPALDEPEESTPDEDYEWRWRSNKPSKKSKSSNPLPNVTLDTSSKTLPFFCPKASLKNKGTYACNYCSRVNKCPLKKVKSHVLLKHSSQLPLVINSLKQSMQKPCTFYVCPHSACYNLSKTKKGFFKHKASHENIRSEKSIMSKVQISSHFNISKKAFSNSGKVQSCSVELDVLDLCKIQLPSANASQLEKKYQCLYCTHYFYDSSLSGMKSHYMSEHEGQLMVMRDTEARRAQLPSRIYVCEVTNCECCYINRPDLYHHSKSHKSSLTYIYECVSCGWYSSSHEAATQHLKTAHSDEKNVSLIHMQVSIDENGQTSKKIL